MAEKRYKKLRTSVELQRLVEKHYLEARYLRFGRPLAWVTSGAPVEILRAMGIVSLYPENYGALCGARGAASALCQASEAQGYSPDLCSYARGSIGSLTAGKTAPLGGLPKPHLLICANNICGTVLKWYEALARYYQVPLFVIDMPFIHDPAGLPPAHAVSYVAAQLEAMVAFVQRVTGRKLDAGKLSHTVELAGQTTRLWREIRELCRARPSPLNAPDLFINMAPIVVLRGSEEAVHFYQHLKAEVEERVSQGVGAITQERVRLLWDNIAIWHRLFRFYNYFADLGACFVVDTYTGGWSMPLPTGEQPGRAALLEAIAATYTAVYLNQSLRHRAERMIELIEPFGVDGFVMHSNRSCKPYSFGQYDIKRIVTERTGRPGLIIEADHTDPRAYADDQVKRSIETFMEALGR